MSKRSMIPVAVLLLAAGWLLNHAYQHVAGTHPARQAESASVQKQRTDAPAGREGGDERPSIRESAPAPSSAEMLRGGGSAGAAPQAARGAVAGMVISPEGVVEVMADNPWRGIPEARIRWDGGEARTDSEGRAPLPPLARAAVVTVWAKGYLPATHRRGQGKILTVILERAETEIQIHDAQTLDPVPGAILRIRVPGTPERERSGSDGIVVIDWHALFPEADALADGAEIFADAPGYLPVMQRIAFKVDRATGASLADPLLILDLVPDWIEGVVLDAESGAPIPGATVHFRREQVETSAEGTFTLPRQSVPEGEESGLRIEAEGYQSRIIPSGQVPEAVPDAPVWMDVELTPAAEAHP